METPEVSTSQLAMVAAHLTDSGGWFQFARRDFLGEVRSLFVERVHAFDGPAIGSRNSGFGFASCMFFGSSSGTDRATTG